MLTALPRRTSVENVSSDEKRDLPRQVSRETPGQ